MKKLILFLLLPLGLSVRAQQVRPLSSADIFRELQQLNVLGTVMYVAAHPDDENTRLLSYLVHHDHVRTIYLSLTRGDGGQNIIGDEQGSVLGLIRTHELMEARRIDGAEQLFTHVIDFGYTKSPEETFKFWDRQQLDKDVMAAVQYYKPDVIICRFPTTGEGGHGQHTVSAIIAGDVYRQLQERKEQASGKDNTWLPTRLLFNSFRFGDNNTTSEDQFKLPINQYDPLLGEGYGEMAGRSRSVHKSQGAGTPQTVGVSNDYFKLLGGKPISNSLYDDVDLSWNRVGHPEIGKKLQEVIDAFDFRNPSASIPKLAEIRKEIALVKDDFWRERKLKELNEIIVSCAGIMVEALTDAQENVEGAAVPVKVNVIARGSAPVAISAIGFKSAVQEGKSPVVTLVNDSLYQFPFTIKLNDPEPLTEPYWLQYDAAHATYQYDSSYAGLPEAVNTMAAQVSFTINGVECSVSAPVSYKKLDPVKGDVVQRLRIVPGVSVEPYQNLLIYVPGHDKKIWVRLKANKTIEKPELLVSYKGKDVYTASLPKLAKGTDTLFSFETGTKAFAHAQDGEPILIAVKDGAKLYDKAQHLIQYPHLPDLQYFTTSSMKLVKKNWQVAISRVGYIEGAGDNVDNILSLTDLNVEQVGAADLGNAQRLQKYQAIVLGVRALNTRKDAAALMPVLMKYVENGGTLLVQYNTNGNLQTTQYGPYPFTISRDRVTDEDAAVTFTDTASSLLSFPNKITQDDFKGWVQERGIYFPSGFEAHYKSLFSMHDVNEKPLDGAVIYTPYGKGHYIYTSLVFFRQLPAGNAGAIRLMMNLLSAGGSKKALE